MLSRAVSSKEEFLLSLGRNGGESWEIFLPMMLLNCLQLNIIFMLKRHILGWHTLVSFRAQPSSQIHTISGTSQRKPQTSQTLVNSHCQSQGIILSNLLLLHHPASKEQHTRRKQLQAPKHNPVRNHILRHTGNHVSPSAPATRNMRAALGISQVHRY